MIGRRDLLHTLGVMNAIARQHPVTTPLGPALRRSGACLLACLLLGLLLVRVARLFRTVPCRLIKGLETFGPASGPPIVRPRAKQHGASAAATSTDISRPGVRCGLVPFTATRLYLHGPNCRASASPDRSPAPADPAALLPRVRSAAPLRSPLAPPLSSFGTCLEFVRHSVSGPAPSARIRSAAP
jgi:hypothetical protein